MWGLLAMSASWMQCDPMVLQNITVGEDWVKSYKGSFHILSYDCTWIDSHREGSFCGKDFQSLKGVEDRVFNPGKVGTSPLPYFPASKRCCSFSTTLHLYWCLVKWLRINVIFFYAVMPKLHWSVLGFVHSVGTFHGNEIRQVECAGSGSHPNGACLTLKCFIILSRAHWISQGMKFSSR